MFAHHAVFGGVEEVVEQMLVPGWGGGGREGAQAYGEDIHVEECYLGPIVEGGGEAECWGQQLAEELEG